MYTYSMNKKDIRAANVSEAIELFHILYPNEELRSVVRKGGNKR